MIKKHNLFKLFATLGLFGLFADSEDGAGSDNNDEFDEDLDEDDNNDENNQDSNDDKEIDKTELDEIKKKLEALEAERDEAQHNQQQINAVKELKAKHNDFNETEIIDYLNKLYEKDPEEAVRLNNKTGWELLYLTEFQKKEVKNDHPNLGRNVTPVDRTEEFDNKLKNGVSLSLDEQAKYFN